MLTNTELFLYGFWVIILLPLAVASLITGKKPAESSIFSKYYRAQPYLNLAGNIFLLTLCAQAITKLAGHFGAMSPERTEEIVRWIDIPFLTMLVVVLVLFATAIVRVRRANRNSKRDERSI